MPGVPDMSKPQGQRQGAAPTGGYEHGEEVAAAQGEDAGGKLHDTRGQIDHR